MQQVYISSWMSSLTAYGIKAVACPFIALKAELSGSVFFIKRLKEKMHFSLRRQEAQYIVYRL